MNLLLMQSNKFQGMPRNGLQMCLDPYKDCYGKNVLPVGAENFSTGWTVSSETVATVTGGQSDPNGGNKAYRIQCTASSDANKYRTISQRYSPCSIKLWVNNINNKPAIIKAAYSGISVTVPANTAQWVTINASPITVAGEYLRISMQVGSDSLDIIAFQPQVNLGQLYPYALPSGLPTNPLNNYKNEIVQNGASLGTDSNDVSFTGLSYQMNTTANADNYLLVAKGREYDNQSTFTCIFVLNATASGGGGYARLFDKAGSTLQGILAYVDVNGKINFARYNGEGNYKTWTTTNAIAWGTTYIVIIKASRNLTDSAVEIFVNGAKQTLTTLVVGTPALADDSTQDLLLGNRISLDRYFLGDFYSVDWTSKLLTDSEVAGLTKYLKTYWFNKGMTI